MANVITTVLRMDAKQLRTGLQQVKADVAQTEGLTNKLRTGWSGMIASFTQSPVAIGAATAAVTTFGAASVKAASDLEESVNAVNVVFGESADIIQEFGEDAAKNVGLATAEFNQLATPLGSILKNTGLAMDEVANKTIELTTRAADMASVFGGSVGDALSAIQAGLRGELDPLERFGVKLSAVTVEQRALADTGKDTAKELTEQEKALARINIIMEQTDQVAGDFKDTSGDLANQTRILKAEFENFQATVGKELIPILSDLAAAAIVASDGLQTIREGIQDIPGFQDFNPFASGLGFLRQSIDRVSQAWGEAEGEAGTFNAVIRSMLPEINEAGRVVRQAADAIGGGGSSLVEQMREFGSEAADAGQAADRFADAVEDAIEEKAVEAFDRLADAADRALQRVSDAIDAVNDRLTQQDVLADIADGWDEIADAQEKAATGGEEDRRDLERAIRDQRREVLSLLESIKSLPARQVIELTTQIETASLGELQRIVSNLKAGINVPVSFNPQPGFTGANISAAPGLPPQLTFSGVQSAIPSGNMQVTNIFPVGSTPTTQYIDGQIDARRNGTRNIALS